MLSFNTSNNHTLDSEVLKNIKFKYSQEVMVTETHIVLGANLIHGQEPRSPPYVLMNLLE